MAYLEPGVYSKTISRRPNTGGNSVALIPLVIGSGATKMLVTEVIKRGSSESDALPNQAVEIKSIGYTPKKSDFTQGTDYSLSEDKLSVKWLTEQGGEKQPKLGESYSVTYVCEVPADQYVTRLITSSTQLEAIYGSDLTIDGEINNLVTAAKILLESGVSELYVRQVKPNESNKVTATDYQKALDEDVQFIEDVWRIVPADLGDAINSVIDGHVTKCSSYEERKERCAAYGKEGGSSLTTAEDVLSTIGGAAESKANTRTSMVYPTSAMRTFSDGSTRPVTAQFIAAMYAGMEASLPLYQSKTRATSGVFTELTGVKLTRVEKNKLAEKGVMIFEQPAGPGTNIICRHQLTTDMASAETRENSVLACKDYVAKRLRGILDTYIGKYNITADTISKVKGSIEAAFAELVQGGYIISGALESIAQDEYNPDTLIIEVGIKVPYPCNYIKLTIMSE